MEIKKSEEQEVITTVTNKKNEFTIDEEGTSFIIEALSKTIYKNPIGTIIREYVSNAFDANKEAGVDEPVIIELGQDYNGDFFSVTDFGVGLSEDRVQNVFCRYGKSTKRNTNEQIGGFGIGAKSAFAYTDTFHIKTVYDNVFYHYTLTKTNTVPVMQLFYSEPRETKNSTEILIYIKSADKRTFKEEISKQLRYFRNVYFKNNDEFNDNVEFLEFEHFRYAKGNDKNNFQYTHLCIGDVNYPLDFGILGIQTLRIPVALKFSIGELNVTLSREEIQYDEESIKKIKDKISLMKQEMQSLIDNKQYIANSLKEFVLLNQDQERLDFLGDKIRLDSYFKFKKIVHNTFPKLKISDLKDFLNVMYKPFKEIKKDGSTTKVRLKNFSILDILIENISYSNYLFLLSDIDNKMVYDKILSEKLVGNKQYCYLFKEEDLSHKFLLKTLKKCLGFSPFEFKKHLTYKLFLDTVRKEMNTVLSLYSEVKSEDERIARLKEERKEILKFKKSEKKDKELSMIAGYFIYFNRRSSNYSSRYTFEDFNIDDDKFLKRIFKKSKEEKRIWQNCFESIKTGYKKDGIIYIISDVGSEINFENINIFFKILEATKKTYTYLTSFSVEEIQEFLKEHSSLKKIKIITIEELYKLFNTEKLREAIFVDSFKEKNMKRLSLLKLDTHRISYNDDVNFDFRELKKKYSWIRDKSGLNINNRNIPVIFKTALQKLKPMQFDYVEFDCLLNQYNRIVDNNEILFRSVDELRHVSYEKRLKTFRKIGFLKSLNSYEPIDKWERELISQSKVKENYLQSLNK